MEAKVQSKTAEAWYPSQVSLWYSLYLLREQRTRGAVCWHWWIIHYVSGGLGPTLDSRMMHLPLIMIALRIITQVYHYSISPFVNEMTGHCTVLWDDWTLYYHEGTASGEQVRGKCISYDTRNVPGMTFEIVFFVHLRLTSFVPYLVRQKRKAFQSLKHLALHISSVILYNTGPLDSFGLAWEPLVPWFLIYMDVLRQLKNPHEAYMEQINPGQGFCWWANLHPAHQNTLKDLETGGSSSYIPLGLLSHNIRNIGQITILCSICTAFSSWASLTEPKYMSKPRITRFTVCSNDLTHLNIMSSPGSFSW